jgi:multisubunit Na+/H+ antiporter MnhF subunit
MVGIALALCAYRAARGPSTPDRVMGLDAITLNIMAIMALMSIAISETLYNLVLIIAILSLVASVAVAKYIVERKVISRGDD